MVRWHQQMRQQRLLAWRFDQGREFLHDAALFETLLSAAPNAGPGKVIKVPPSCRQLPLVAMFSWRRAGLVVSGAAAPPCGRLRRLFDCARR